MLELSDKRCICGNQYETLFGHLYCHKCDIDDDTLDSLGERCDCDYCKARRDKLHPEVKPCQS